MATVPAVDERKIEAPPTHAWSMSVCAIGLLCAVAFLPLLAMHAEQLWVRPHYQFFPIVLIGAAILVWTRRSSLQQLRPGSKAVSIGMAAFAWLLLAGAELLNSSWLGAVAFLFLLLAVLHSLGLARRLFVVWLYLWLLIPPPFGLDNRLIISLQTLATRWSSSLLDLIGVPHVIAGHIMEVGGQKLFVEEACAGINSLFSILACSLFYVFWMRIPPIRAIVLLLASVGWVLIANVARVFLIAYLPRSWGLAEGWRHDTLGFLLFACALGLIWSTNCLILFFTPYSNKEAESEAPAEPPIDTTEGQTLPVTLNQSLLSSWIAGAAFGLLFVAHVGVYVLPQLAVTHAPGSYTRNVSKLNEDSLPAELDGWQRGKMTEENRSAMNAFGQYSKIWGYKAGANSARVSVDYPFPAWHELSECYYGQGWELELITDQTGKGSGQPASYCEQKMKKSGLRFGYLYFCQIDSTGQVLKPPARGIGVANIYRQESALQRLLAWTDNSDKKIEVVHQIGPVYQCQLFVETFSQLTPADQEKNRARFFTAYKELNAKLMAESK